MMEADAGIYWLLPKASPSHFSQVPAFLFLPEHQFPSFVRKLFPGGDPVLPQPGGVLLVLPHTKHRDFKSATARRCPHS